MSHPDRPRPPPEGADRPLKRISRYVSDLNRSSKCHHTIATRIRCHRVCPKVIHPINAYSDRRE